MAEITLTPRERQELKGRAHGLDPVVLLGSGGLSPAVLKEIDRALAAHELIKVRVPGDDRDEREAIFRQVADQLAAARVQAIGKLLVLFRPLPDDAPAGTEPPVPGRPAPPRARKAAPLTKKAAANRAPRGSKPQRSDIRQERRAAPRRAPAKGGSRSGRR
jgi:putative YhbY family RNA-binding protein